MTRLFNDPTRFADELTAGFVAAHRQWVRRVPGGMIRATRSVAPTVAVVTGGGSGHYPAFAGYVGQGLAHGAAMGNLFASPSAQQVYAVARAADRGAGVLFCYGNYAGDVLHFRQAQDRLNDEGVAARTVTVTDDISSAPLDEMHKRRGIAGDVAVLMVAGTAQLLPRMGRARPLAEKSLGTPDAGAVSLARIVRAVGACTGPDRTATERVAR